jgi:hypothetical protein
MPEIRAKLPDGSIGVAEGDLAPELAQAQMALDLAGAGARDGARARHDRPVFAIHEVKAREADELLVDFGHPLGPYKPNGRGRGFGYMAFICEAFGRPVCVLISASTPNQWVSKRHGLHRYNVVELARIARADTDRDATLAAVRLWTTYLAPIWPERYGKKWARLDAAVSYSLPGTPSAMDEMKGMYHRLGFKSLGERRPSKPGPNSRQNVSQTDFIANGIKRLWVWEYTKGVSVPESERNEPLSLVPMPPRGVDLRAQSGVAHEQLGLTAA